MLTLLIVLAIVYAVWLAILVVMQDTMLFPRAFANTRLVDPPRDAEVWSMRHDDGITTETWFVPAHGGNGETEPRPTIVLFHGNAMLVSDWADWAAALAARGFNVVLPEFRGYGRSGGVPSREALVADATRSIERAMEDPRVDPARIALYGRSIGGMVAAEAAVGLRGPPALVVLHTTPARISDLASRYLAPPFLVRHRFDAEAALRALAARRERTERGVFPEFVVIGHRDDEIVPRSHTRRLAAAAGVEPLEVGGTHNRAATMDDENLVDRAIDEAFARLSRPR